MKKIILILLLSNFLLSCATSKDTSQTVATSKNPYANKVAREGNVTVNYSFSKEESVWHENNSKLEAIESVAGFVEASIGQAFKQAFLFDFKNKFAIIANETMAFDVIKEESPVFYIRSKPTETGVARLTVQTERDRRFVWLVNRVGSNQANFHPPEDSIAFKWAKTQIGGAISGQSGLKLVEIII